MPALTVSPGLAATIPDLIRRIRPGSDLGRVGVGVAETAVRRINPMHAVPDERLADCLVLMMDKHDLAVTAAWSAYGICRDNPGIGTLDRISTLFHLTLQAARLPFDECSRPHLLAKRNSMDAGQVGQEFADDCAELLLTTLNQASTPADILPKADHLRVLTTIMRAVIARGSQREVIDHMTFLVAKDIWPEQIALFQKQHAMNSASLLVQRDTERGRVVHRLAETLGLRMQHQEKPPYDPADTTIVSLDAFRRAAVLKKAIGQPAGP